MPTKPCGQPGCPILLTDGSTRCTEHTYRRGKRSPDRRPTASARGYGSKWQRIIAPAYVRAHPICIDCGAPSKVPDHAPVDRRDLVAQGEPHPDAWQHLQPRCLSCHNGRTARRRGGGTTPAA